MMAAAASASSCNEDYNLTKDIDTDISIDGDISAPLGDSELILVDDFLNLGNDDSDVLKSDDSGNYYISVAGSGTSSDVSLPVFSFSDNLVTGGGYMARIYKSELPLPGSGTVPSISYTKSFNASTTPLTVNEDVPSEITAVRSVQASGTVAISMRLSAGKATISSLVMDFPDYLKFADVKDASMTLNTDGNILTIRGMELTASPKRLDLYITGVDFDKIPAGQGFIASQHKIVLNDEIALGSFDISAVLSDFGTTVQAIPSEISADISLAISSLDVKSAEVKADPSISIDPVNVKVGTLPEFVRGDGVVLDLYNPALMLNVNNRTPLKLDLNADIRSYKGSDVNSVHIGSATGGAPVALNASAVNKLYVSRTGDDVPAGMTSVVVPGLSSIISNVPERIGISGISVKAADEFVTLVPGSRYDVTYDYEVAAPLAFGKDVHIAYSTDFTGWSETFDDDSFSVDVRNADVKFEFVNMIPLGISLSADAIDSDGKVIPGIAVTLDGSAPAGSVENPSVTALTLNMKGKAEDMRRLDGIRIDLVGSDPDNMLGVCLNRNQGVLFRDMKLRLQGKVDIDVDL